MGGFGFGEHGVVLPAGVVMGDVHQVVLAKIFKMKVAGWVARANKVAEN